MLEMTKGVWNDDHKPSVKIGYYTGHYGIRISIFQKTAYSKSVINAPLPRITCFRVAVFSELGWEVVYIHDLNSMLKIVFVFQKTPSPKCHVFIKNHDGVMKLCYNPYQLNCVTMQTAEHHNIGQLSE